MSNRRSCILLVALVVIGYYLYYESIREKAELETFLKEEYSGRQFIETAKHGRRLLFISEENDSAQIGEYIPNPVPKDNFKSTIDSVMLSKKRRKRETNKTEFLVWDFHVNVTRLKNETNKGNSTLKLGQDLKSEEGKDQSLKMSVYVAGNGPKQSSELQHAWSEVEKLIKGLFGKVSKEQYTGVLNVNDANNKNIKVSGNKVTIVKENKVPNKSPGRQRKFISSLFNFGGGNSENPPHELGSGEILENLSNQTELMLDLAFITEGKDSNDHATDNIPLLSEISSQPHNLSISSVSGNDQQSVIIAPTPTHISNALVSDHVTQSFETFSVKPNCQNCTLSEESIFSNESRRKDIEVIMSTDVTELFEISEESDQMIELYCMELLSDSKSPRFLDTGSGDSFIENIVDGGIHNQTVETTTRLADLPKSQAGILQNLWSSLANLGFRNERKILENSETVTKSISEESEEEMRNRLFLSGIFNGFGSGRLSETELSTESLDLNDFSLNDCKRLFMKSKSSNNSIENSHEKLNTESKLVGLNIPSGFSETPFLTSNLITVTETDETSNSQNELESARAVKVTLNPVFDKTTEAIVDELPNSNIANTDPQDTSITFKGEELSVASNTINSIHSIDSIFKDTDTRLSQINGDNRNLEVTEDDSRSRFGESLKTTQEPDTLNQSSKFINAENNILEVDSSDERSLFGSFLNSGERELKISDIDQETTTVLDETGRRFVPNFLNFGSGSSEISEINDSIEEIDLMVDTENQNRSFENFFNFSSGERSLLETEFDTEISVVPLSINKLPEFEMHKETTTNKAVNVPILNPKDINKNSEHRFFLNGFGSGDVPSKETVLDDDSPMSFINATKGNDKKISGLISNETTFQVDVNCINCSDASNTVPIDCDNCEEIKKLSIHSTASKESNLKINVTKRMRSLTLDETVHELEIKSKLDDLNENIPTQMPKFPDETLSPLNIATVLNDKLLGSGISNVDNITPSVDLSTQSKQHSRTQNPPFRRGARANDVFDWPMDFKLLEVATNSESKVPKNTQMSSFTLPSEVISNNIGTNNFQTNSVDNAATDSSVSVKTRSVELDFLATNEDSAGTSVNPNAEILALKFCRSARECDISLNERCISKVENTVCDCGRTFVRNSKNRRCEATITLHTFAKLPREQFHEDLKDRNSELFRIKSGEAKLTMLLLLRNKPEIHRTVAEVDINGFERGSLVVKYNLKVLKEGNVTELVQKIDEDLKELFKNEDIQKMVPLQIHNATVSTLVANPCLSSESNYCEKNARCIPEGNGEFKCECKENYVDDSQDNLYPGEVCKALCPLNYCGENGQCELNSFGEKHCFCDGWYFGEKCNISGIIVTASFGVINVVVIIIVLIIVCTCKKRRRKYNRSLSQLQSASANSTHSHRIRDTIALNDVGPSRVSNVMAISTPLFEQAPVIKVTSPSYQGSSIDYDSTFDRSRSYSSTSENECDPAKKV